ncbi:MAG: nucleoside diphosphate kinase regulator [Pseudomonadales bacterium]|nr:nucleoside diphosphate kinase regulator [Pseudomonadales bacterium]
MNSKPEITLSRIDADRLERLLDGLGDKSFPGRLELENELTRANVVEPTKVPSTVVTMNSVVRFSVASSGAEFSLRLVYPKDADGSSDKVSILAPVGSALLGLSEGDEIAWPAPGGNLIKVKIIEVTYQPERSGDLNL